MCLGFRESGLTLQNCSSFSMCTAVLLPVCLLQLQPTEPPQSTAAASRTTRKHSGLKLNRDRGRDGECVCVCVHALNRDRGRDGCVCVCVCVLAMPFCSSQTFHDFLLPSGQAYIVQLGLQSPLLPRPRPHFPLELTQSSTQDPLNLHIWADSCVYSLAQLFSDLTDLDSTCPSLATSASPPPATFFPAQVSYLAPASPNSLGSSYLSHSLVTSGATCVCVSCIPEQNRGIVRARTISETSVYLSQLCHTIPPTSQLRVLCTIGIL